MEEDVCHGLKEDEIAGFCGWVDGKGHIRVSCVMPTKETFERIWAAMPPPTEEDRQAWLALKTLDTST